METRLDALLIWHRMLQAILHLHANVHVRVVLEPSNGTSDTIGKEFLVGPLKIYDLTHLGVRLLFVLSSW